MKTAKKEKVLLKDNVVKKLFTNGSRASKEYLTRIISYTLDIPLEEVKDNFELIHPEIALNNHMVNS